jgi:hypothetical protein
MYGALLSKHNDKLTLYANAAESGRPSRQSCCRMGAKRGKLSHGKLPWRSCGRAFLIDKDPCMCRAGR